MNFLQFASVMYPYWIVGIVIILSVMSTSYKDLLKIDKKAIKNWIKFLCLVLSIRFLIHKMMPGSPIFKSANSTDFLPWAVPLTVFWEDAVHGLPLLILRKLIGVNKWTKPLHMMLTFLVMIEFGLGHAYQGLLAIFIMALYVPYSIKIGEKYGFGTVMIGHVLYDSFILFFIRYLMGL